MARKKFWEKKRDLAGLSKKSSCKERTVNNDAVEEVLCFGWIDSTVKSLDEDNSIQRFSPRNPKSSYSQSNKEKIRWLLYQGMIHPSMLNKANEIASEKFDFPTPDNQIELRYISF